jgi:hypothetical protein
MATIVALALLVSFAISVGAAIVLISAGIRHEERKYTTLTSKQAPGRVSEGARRLTGLYVRDVHYRETTLV